MSNQVITKKSFKEPMFFSHIGSSFEKNAKLQNIPGHHYIIVQNGEFVGASKGGSGVLLNKKCFSKLKCGLFSKTVSADIYSANDYSFEKKYFAGKTQYGFNIHMKVSIKVKDEYKLYSKIVNDLKTVFYLGSTLEGVYCDFIDESIKEIAPTLSFPPTEHSIFITTAPLKEEAKEVYDKLKVVLNRKFSVIGCEVSINPVFPR